MQPMCPNRRKSRLVQHGVVVAVPRVVEVRTPATMPHTVRQVRVPTAGLPLPIAVVQRPVAPLLQHLRQAYQWPCLAVVRHCLRAPLLVRKALTRSNQATSTLRQR